jgi:alpha-tubulin suppressor-like RCC1 family protein
MSKRPASPAQSISILDWIRGQSARQRLARAAACGALLGLACSNSGAGQGNGSLEPGNTGLPSNTGTVARNSMRQLTGVAQVSVAAGHYCIVMLDGTVRCIGDSEVGGEDSSYGQEAPTEVPGVQDAVQVVTQSFQSCVLLTSGRIQCWGSGYLGNGTEEASLSPVDVVGIDSARAISKNGHCVVLADGTVWCWGPRHGPAPEPIPEINTAIDVSVGSSHECALLSDRRVQCWGDNSSGQLGREGPDSDTPVDVVDIDDAEAISLGGEHSCVLREGGSVWCWGDAEFLGEGTTEDSASPVPIQGIPADVAVATNGDVVCVQTADGDLWCWGRGPQEGFGALFPSIARAPAERSDVGGVVDFDLGSILNIDICAVFADTTAKCSSSRTFTLLDSSR